MQIGIFSLMSSVQAVGYEKSLHVGHTGHPKVSSGANAALAKSVAFS